MKSKDIVESKLVLVEADLLRAKRKQKILESRLAEENDPEKLLAMLKDSARLGYDMLELRGQKEALEWVWGYKEWKGE